jgi:hypothetical protein
MHARAAVDRRRKLIGEEERFHEGKRRGGLLFRMASVTSNSNGLVFLADSACLTAE